MWNDKTYDYKAQGDPEHESSEMAYIEAPRGVFVDC